MLLVLISHIDVANEPREEDAMDDSDDLDVWKGNRRRRLWKSACIQAALNVCALSAYRSPTPYHGT